MIVTYAFSGSLRRAMPSGNETSPSGSRSTAGTRRPGASIADCSRIGSRFRFCVPTMTSTARERFRICAPSCCATQPATATIGRSPVSSSRWWNSPSLVNSFSSARSRTLQVLISTTSASRSSDGRLVARLIEKPGQTFRVVNVHLAAVGLDVVLPGHVVRVSLSLVSDFRFRLSPCLRSTAGGGVSRPDTLLRAALQHFAGARPDGC